MKRSQLGMQEKGGCRILDASSQHPAGTSISKGEGVASRFLLLFNRAAD